MITSPHGTFLFETIQHTFFPPYPSLPNLIVLQTSVSKCFPSNLVVQDQLNPLYLKADTCHEKIKYYIDKSKIYDRSFYFFVESISITNLSVVDIDYELIPAGDDSLNRQIIDCSIVQVTVLPS